MKIYRKDSSYFIKVGNQYQQFYPEIRNNNLVTTMLGSPISLEEPIEEMNFMDLKEMLMKESTNVGSLNLNKEEKSI